MNDRISAWAMMMPTLTCVLLSGCSGCGELFAPAALMTPDGEEVLASDFELNARPQYPSDVTRMYEGYQGSSLVSRTWADRAGGYLLYQTLPGYDAAWNAVGLSPITLLHVEAPGMAPRALPAPDMIPGKTLSEQLEAGCDFVPTLTPGLLAMFCEGRLGRLLPGASSWTYEERPASLAGQAPRVVASDSALYGGAMHPTWVGSGGGQVVETADAPGAIGGPEAVLEHWIGPWDGGRARILYKVDDRELCAGIWSFATAQVTDRVCQRFEVPGVGPLSHDHLAGSVEETIFFASAGSNGVQAGDLIWASVSAQGFTIHGRLSDRGGLGSSVGVLAPPRLFMPQVTEHYVTITPGFAVSTQNGLEVREMFDASGGYDWVRIGSKFGINAEWNDYRSDVVGEDKPCGGKEGLKVCRSAGNSFRATRHEIDATRSWSFAVQALDTRVLVLGSTYDLRDQAVTTLTPDRVVDDYVPLMPGEGGASVTIASAPGFSPQGGSVDLSACATVYDASGQPVERDAQGRFAVAFDEDHRIVLSGCDPEDGYLPLLDVEAMAMNESLGRLPAAWRMEGVELARGVALMTGSREEPRFIPGVGAMMVHTQDGWLHLSATRFESDVRVDVVDAVDAAYAPAFIGVDGLVLRAGGEVIAPASGAVVSTLVGVEDPSSVQHFAYGQLVAHSGTDRLTIWRAEEESVVSVRDISPAPPGSLLDMDDAASTLLFEREEGLFVYDALTGEELRLTDFDHTTARRAQVSADGDRVLVTLRSPNNINDSAMFVLSRAQGGALSTQRVALEVRDSAEQAEHFDRESGRWATAFREVVTLHHVSDEGLHERQDVSLDPAFPGLIFMIADGRGYLVIRAVSTTDEAFHRLSFDGEGGLEVLQTPRPVRDAISPQKAGYRALWAPHGRLRAIGLDAPRDAWLRYDDGYLEMAGPIPLWGGRAAHLPLMTYMLTLGEVGLDGALLGGAYEVAHTPEVDGQRLLFHGDSLEEDAAFIDAPCLPYKTTPMPDYITSRWPEWICAR